MERTAAAKAQGGSGEMSRRNEGATTAAAAAVSSSRPPCRFFLLGKCKFGESCTFSHEPSGRVPVCRFFEKNRNCRYGKDCKFLHGNAAAGGGSTNTNGIAAAAAASSGAAGEAGNRSSAAAAGVGGGATEANSAGGGEARGATEGDGASDASDCCGICLENIPASGKRFGLMNCDHVFCLDCLRTWRKSKGAQKDISRTCPECRKVSFFLVPSKEHLKGKVKAKAFQDYKKGLSKIPCKYHKVDGSNSCPFGSRCFYAHLDKNGEDVKGRPSTASTGGGSGGTGRCPYFQRNGGAGARGSAAGRGSVTYRGTEGRARQRSTNSEPGSEWEDMEALDAFGERMDLGIGHMTILAQLGQLERAFMNMQG